VSIDVLITRMETMLGDLSPDNPRRFFHSTYMRTTIAVKEELGRRAFLDNDWVERWDVSFAGLYLDALEEYENGRVTPGPWTTAFGAVDGPHLPPLRHVLLGMNAHINFDLPQALIRVITDEEFGDAELIATRANDHEHIDEILASRVAAEDVELKKVEQPGDRTLLDLILQPFNRQATRRFLKEARQKVWGNAKKLSDARQQGPAALTQRLAELEALSQARVADLRGPGLVVLELARNGFGVVLT
jgi:hypothetical protein